MKLVVIEGIGKLETVQKYLGDGYRVFATKGHVRDLPQKSLAVDVKNNFEPKYTIIPDKKEVVEKLSEAAAKADAVLLATDPDREGEAISWHVANILNIPKTAPVRIAFNEISKNAIQEALQHPRVIDENLVDAQQARRVLDRLVGYKVSPVLCKKIRNKLSAGRVQSVTLRLVVEREREILNFKPEEFWNFASVLEADDKTIKAALFEKHGKKYKLTCKEDVDSTVADLKDAKYIVSSVKRTVTKSHPPAPFITSTMQQDALNKLGMSLKQTSQAAQTLYEGVDIPGEGKVALITYIRTDSTRIAENAITAAREFINDKFGAKYVPDKPNFYRSKKSAQDAHEAIRPIDLARTPESLAKVLERNLFRLYKLIYERFLACQMADATYNSLSMEIGAGGYGFKVTGRTPLFDGYTRLYNAYQEEKENDTAVALLPDLVEGQELKFIKYDYEQKFTKPPARYTEASLVKTMEEIGIGRPATYTPTVTLLAARGYTEKEGKAIKATELGMSVTDMLVKYFPTIMDVKFTAQMEEKLDEIEEGNKQWQKVIDEFYDGFEDSIKNAMGDDYTMKEPDIQTEHICDKCGAKMVIKTGRFGRFLACPSYPKCKNTKEIDDDGNIVEHELPQESDVVCDKCGAKMVVKTGRYGKFLACPNYPKCKNIKNIEGENKGASDLPACPSCGKNLRYIARGPRSFYGCSGYPDCKFISSYKPVDKRCPKCNSILTQRKGKNGEYLKCWNKECDYVEKPESGSDENKG